MSRGPKPRVWLELRGGEWYAVIVVTTLGPLVERGQRSTRQHTEARRAGRSGGRWGVRAQHRARFAVPLGTRDEAHAQAILQLVTGEAAGPLPTAKLTVARDLYAGTLAV